MPGVRRSASVVRRQMPTPATMIAFLTRRRDERFGEKNRELIPFGLKLDYQIVPPSPDALAYATPAVQMVGIELSPAVLT